MVAKLEDLLIDPELKPYLDAGCDAQVVANTRAQLAANIQEDGEFTDAITVWRGRDIIVDGMTRYDIWKNELQASKEIMPRVVERSFKSKSDVLSWMIRHQRGRRNWTVSQLAFHMAKIKAREGLTEQQAAEMGGVSPRSVFAASHVLANGSEILKHAVESGEVTVNDAATIADLPKSEQNNAVRKKRSGKSKTVAGAAGKKKRAPKKPKEREPGDETENEKFDPEVERLKNLVGAKPKPERQTVDKELPVAERAGSQVKMLEAFCRLVTKCFDDNLPDDPWLDESQVEIAKSQLKSCMGVIRAMKAHDKPCPKCHGKRCKHCHESGYMPKHMYEAMGGGT